jgi:hypothetical protein
MSSLTLILESASKAEDDYCIRSRLRFVDGNRGH